ncbi:DUF4097 family beta strand repeat protein [Granulicella sp. 5B5]|uniref:DUF4097 family beta strand repeat-containing protein n=1 Tax=Granulicella sp. 5B5 TaxID=1617967 RepID=UPI0015F461E2|nr:DUF4097 family beta strand repeat-containing protein [Granulicella sp. 5B5]QMV19169.1 DUF4097 family beta strand repeat protein [Granulicella sp. 5B5]
MSAYPPPPPMGGAPPPAGGPYPPYDRNAARAQYRAQQAAYRAQQKMQRIAWKAQRRATRRTSIVGPLILLGLGVYFLLVELHRVSAFYALEWFGHWWPVVLIAAGVILLAEWALDRDRAAEMGCPRSIGGGIVFLLVLLILTGLASQAALRGLEWKHQKFGEGFGKLDQVLGNRSDSYDDVSSAIAANGLLVIRNPHGDVTVNGTSTDGQMHVSIHKSAYAWNEADVQTKMKQLEPAIQHDGNTTTLSVAGVVGGQADLTVTMPPSSGITVNADHGDVTVSELQKPVTISANHGDVDVREIAGDLQATINDDDASVSVKDMTGSVTINGHTGDINVNNVTGPVAMQGDFYGTTDLQNVSGSVRFDTSRTHFQAAKLGDEFSVESDSLNASALTGPVVLKTTDKNITLDRVQGSVDVINRNGEVNVTSVAPLGTVSIQNTHGSVDVGLPPGSSFKVDASTRNGDMENDFGLSQQDNDDNHTLHGSVGGGSTKVTISTTDGDVTLRKVTAAPMPPAPPAPPAMTEKAPKAPAAPKAPKAPVSDKAPKSYSF